MIPKVIMLQFTREIDERVSTLRKERNKHYQETETNWQEVNNSQLMIRNMLEMSKSLNETNQTEVLTQLEDMNSLIKTGQEEQNTLKKIIETNEISLKNKIEDMKMTMQNNHSIITENIDFNQKELYEIHTKTGQLMEDIRSLEDVQNKLNNERRNEQENQNKKMLGSIINTMEDHKNQIIINQFKIQTKENELSMTRWNNQKNDMETSRKILNQIDTTANGILTSNQKHQERIDTLIERTSVQGEALDSLKEITTKSKELLKIIPQIDANIMNHINNCKQTIQEVLNPLSIIEKVINQNTKSLISQDTQSKNISNLINKNHKIILQKLENTLPDWIKTQFGFHDEKLPQLLDESHERQKTLLTLILQAIKTLNEQMNEHNREELIFQNDRFKIID
jgi:hypothetical protein